MSRILVLVPGALTGRLSGPEIRAWELARALSRLHPVTAAVHHAAPGRRDGVRIVPWTRGVLLREALRHDAVISACLPPFLLAAKPLHRFIAVSDQYDPQEHELNLLEPGRYRAHELWAAGAIRELQLRHADLVLCAGTRQREALLECWPDAATAPPPVVIPFGLDDPPPPPRHRPLRERFPQIAVGDTVVLWWGSVWRWLDAATAIRAVAQVARDRPDVKLVITAGRAPAGQDERFAATEEARALARELGVLDRHVLFVDDWIPYDTRHEVLADADIGLTLPRDAAEARLAARARYLDYLWAGLPCVLGRGDETAQELAEAGFATLVEPGDPAALARQLVELADRPQLLMAAREAGARLADERRWPVIGATLSAALATVPPPRRTGPSRALVDLLAGTAAYYAGRAADRLGASVPGRKHAGVPGVDAV